MQTLFELPVEALIADVTNGHVAEYYRIIDKTKRAVLVRSYYNKEQQAININSVVNQKGIGNYFTYDNSPELFAPIQHEIDFHNMVNLFYPIHTLEEFKKEFGS